MTHVVFNGQLKNKTDRSYASSYAMNVGFDDIENASAFDGGGTITPTIKKTDKGKSISLNFNQQVVGVNNILHFTFAFDTPNVATHIGNIWEVDIPGIANQNDFSAFNVHVRVPGNFGQPSYIKPSQAGSSLDFDKSILGNSGISIAFGKDQTYDFTLLYHLQNRNLFPITTEIALPPDTNYQRVTINDISPKPINVIEDNDGNWLAQYSLLPSQKITITAKGSIKTMLHPDKKVLSAEEKKIYTRPQQYWDSNNSKIQKLAQELKTPQAIFDYVVHQLTYDFSRVAGQQQRLGAQRVLDNPSSAVCLEFTDLFIALARAAGIPAREVDGYAYTQNTQERPLSLVKDILHAWPEYYDTEKQAWIMVDPTWENTTKGTDYFDIFDFDHITFAIKGEKSTYPVPAGGYKLVGGENVKDIFMTFGNDFPTTDQQLTALFDMRNTQFAGTAITGNITLSNVGQQAITPQQIIITATKLNPHKQLLTMTKDIPPYGHIQSTIGFEKTDFLTNAKEVITMQIGDKTLTKAITIYPIFLKTNYLIGGIIGVISCIILFIAATRAWRLFTSQR